MANTLKTTAMTTANVRQLPRTTLETILKGQAQRSGSGIYPQTDKVLEPITSNNMTIEKIFDIALDLFRSGKIYIGWKDGQFSAWE